MNVLADMKRLSIVTTHPIQYNAPLFTMLHQRGNIAIKVFYTWGEDVLKKKYDPGFGKTIEWDIPLLEGYEYSFVKNVSKDPGSHHFKGINNPSLIAEIKSWKADAVLVYGWSFKSHLKVIRYFHKRIPVFFRGDSTLIGERNSFKKKLRLTFLKWIYSKVDKALYVGSQNKNYYLHFGMKETQLVFAPHAIDNNRFSKNEDKCLFTVDKWKNELHIKEEEIVFLYAGKLDDNKNVGQLLEAFTQLPQGNIHILIAGNGDREKQLKASFSSFRNIHFLPFQNQSNMPALYRIADVFVLPSKTETWGLSVNEAMACGKVVLVSDACGAAIDLVRNDENGFTFESQNVPDLIEKMLQCIIDKNRLHQMGKLSMEIIKDWNYENDCKAIESLMNRIIITGNIIK